jgi:NADH-ubiquinone oxidoreductase chain 6
MITTIVNLLTFGILFSSIISITSNNPIISIIFLITAFVNAAGYLILLGINFIGISYIVIYVGAIAVLFLFIILMINIKLTDILDTGYNFTKNLPIGLNIASLLLFILFSVAAHLPFVGTNLFPFFPWPSNPLHCNPKDPKGELLPALASLAREKERGLIEVLGGIPQAGPLPLPDGHSAGRASEEGISSFINSNLNITEISDVNLLEFTQIEVLGHFLYTYASIFLIILSLILLLAMLAIIIISKKNITNI